MLSERWKYASAESKEIESSMEFEKVPKSWSCVTGNLDPECEEIVMARK